MIYDNTNLFLINTKSKVRLDYAEYNNILKINDYNILKILMIIIWL